MKKGQQIEETNPVPSKSNSMYFYIGIVILALFSSFWILNNLDVYMLWQDEAETVCVSQTVLTEGIPKGTDGTNFFSQQEGREYGESYEWKLHPWFQFYWVALFFSLFEASTFMARLPFALLGIGSILLGFFLAMRIWKDKQTATLVAIAFLVNIMFLLLVRQARYYAPVMFFSLYATWGFLDLLEKKKIGYVHFVVASILFFQSQYLFALNFWIACLIYTGLFYKDQLKSVGIAVGMAALPSMPFLLWLLNTPYSEEITETAVSAEGLQYGLSRFTAAFFDFILEPVWLLLLIPIAFLRDSLKRFDMTPESERILLLFVLIIIGNILAIALLVPEYYLRYLCATIPFALLIKGRIGGWLAKVHLAIPLMIFLIVMVYKGDITNYYTEINTEERFVGPVETMVNFLEKESQPTDKIAISFGDMPLKFYLKNPIYGGMAGDLPENLDEMDFIIVRRNAIDQADRKVQLRLYEYLQANSDKFQAYALNVEDSPFQNRETPDEHLYEAPLVTNSLVIHKRK